MKERAFVNFFNFFIYFYLSKIENSLIFNKNKFLIRETLNSII